MNAKMYLVWDCSALWYRLREMVTISTWIVRRFDVNMITLLIKRRGRFSERAGFQSILRMSGTVQGNWSLPVCQNCWEDSECRDVTSWRDNSPWCCSDGSPRGARNDRRSCTCQRPTAYTESGRWCQAGPLCCRRSKASYPRTCERRFPLSGRGAIRHLWRSRSGKYYEQS